jgi:hypothetical protein
MQHRVRHHVDFTQLCGRAVIAVLKRAAGISEAAAKRDQFPIAEHLAADEHHLMPQKRAHEGGELPIIERFDVDAPDFSAKRLSRWCHFDQAAWGVARNIASESHFCRLPSFTSAASRSCDFVGVVSDRRHFVDQ